MDLPRVTSTSAYFHALLRPVILQILRAQGYYSITPVLLDAFTDLAARYLEQLCFRAARNAEHNHEFLPGLNITDTRQAMEQCGVFGPLMDPAAEAWRGEDTQGIEKFVQWVMGEKNAKIRRVALGSLDGNLEGEVEEEPATDYLSALKKKHNKSDQNSKYDGTLLGKNIDHGEVILEGGPSSLDAWQKMMHERAQRPPTPAPDSRPSSSGLSSLTEGDVEMRDL